MSLVNVRSSLKSVMHNLGYSEHLDAFNDQNIAESILDKSYQVVDSPIVVSGPNQTVYEFSYPVSLKVFFNFRSNDTSESIDLALSDVDQIMSQILTKSYISSQFNNGIKDIILSGISQPQQLSSSNDRVFYYEINFNYLLYCTF